MEKNNMNILFTSSGRRVALIEKFKEAFIRGMDGSIITADLKQLQLLILVIIIL